MPIRSLLAAAAVAAVLGACTSGDADQATTDSANRHAEHAGHPMANVVTVVANDFTFDAPSEVVTRSR